MSRRGIELRRAALVFGPALVVAAIGIAVGSWPLRQTLAQTLAQRDAFAGAVPRGSELEAAQSRLAELRAAVAALEPPTIDSSSQAPATSKPEPERAAWHRQLTEVLQRHAIQVVREERSDVAIPASLGSAPSSGRANGRCTAWSLQLAGGYLDLLSALAALQSSQVPFLVLDLTMTRDAEGTLLWTLTVT